jgi:hypothetical protein
MTSQRRWPSAASQLDRGVAPDKALPFDQTELTVVM